MQRAEAGGKKEIVVLDPKRSNAINIGLTVLPPPRTIKAAILKMDNSIMNKEGIEVGFVSLCKLRLQLQRKKKYKINMEKIL